MAMQKAAKITHIPFNKLAARFFMESSWRMVDVQEKDGALSCGISQCGLYAGKRVDPKCTIAKLHNMEYNIIAGAKYYRLLLKKYHGCYAMAISVYTGHKHIAQKLFLAEKKFMEIESKIK